MQVNGEAAEAVAEVLSRYAPRGVAFDYGADPAIVSLVTVKAYLAVDEGIAARRRKIEEGLWHLRQIWPIIPEPAFRTIPEQDWTATWKEQIPVLHLGERVVIRPSWRTYSPQTDEIVLMIDPGMAFGTGLHPTTQLCVTAVEAFARAGTGMLDLGTGTGILAMIAAQLGADPVLGIDNDPSAVNAARRNAAANQLDDRVELRCGSLADVQEAYSLVVANILAPVIIAMAESGLAERVLVDGTLVASGILEAQTDEVAAALQRYGLRVTDRWRQGEWVALIAECPAG